MAAVVAPIAIETGATAAWNARSGLQGTMQRARRVNTTDLKRIGYIVIAVLVVIFLMWYAYSDRFTVPVYVFRQPVTPWRNIPYTSHYFKVFAPDSTKNLI